jgi:pantoate kinase
MTEETARAFVPGHVTGFFSVHRAASGDRAKGDILARSGSRGAGLALSEGVGVTVSPAAERSLRFHEEPVEMSAPMRVLDRLGTSARVEIETELPLGTGFGVSGATALGTALAANAAFDRARTENDLVEIAHAAEVEAGTGLGDVVAQARGGVPLRIEPGGPGAGELDGIPTATRIEYVSFGSLSTAAVLEEDIVGLTEAGERALTALCEQPTIERLMHSSRRFARDAGLLTSQVETAIEDVLAHGGEAAMAMLGETVFALGTGLSDAGYDPAVCSIYPPGAALLD